MVKAISLKITDEQAQIVKDLKYYKDITIKDIFVAGIEALSNNEQK